MDRVILCAGGDMRQTYAAAALCGLGRVYGLGIEAAGGVRAVDSPGDMEERADILVLPILTDNRPGIKVRERFIPFEELMGAVRPGGLALGGRLSPEQEGALRDLGLEPMDYFLDEGLTVKNCIPTAEGALMIAMRETTGTIFGSRVLITGWGRVAKACAEVFRGLRARCTVSARRQDALAQVWCLGLDTVRLEDLAERIGEYDIIINTVPAQVLTRELLEKTDSRAVIIDLASKPGGVDWAAAEEMGRRAIAALGLPGKAAPLSAGRYIADTIRNIIYERGK